MQLAINDAVKETEEKFDGKLDTLQRDLHGRMDRMDESHTKQGGDILNEIKQSNANVTMEFKAINLNTTEILRKQDKLSTTTEQLALNVEEHEGKINTLDEKRETSEKAMIASNTRTGLYMAAATVLCSGVVLGAIGFLFWLLRAMLNTPTP